MATWHISCRKCKEDYYLLGSEGEYDFDELKCGQCDNGDIEVLSYDRSDHGMILMLAEKIFDLEQRIDRLAAVEDVEDENHGIDNKNLNKIVH